MASEKIFELQTKLNKLISLYRNLREENRRLRKENDEIKKKLAIFSEERDQSPIENRSLIKENEELKIKQFRIRQELNHLLERVNQLAEHKA